MKRITMLLILVLFLIVPLSSLQIKLGSQAPEASPWGDALKELAAEWLKISNGEIQIRIFHNAVAGNEDDMLRKMRIGQLQGAVLTTNGLGLIDKALLTLSAPMIFKDRNEFGKTIELVKPDLENRLVVKGYQPIVWNTAGWIHFFSKTKLTSIEQARNRKLTIPGNSDDLFKMMQTMGFKPINGQGLEVLTALNSGMVDTILLVPFAAAGYQLFGAAPHFSDLEFAPILGSIVLSTQTWTRIPANLRPQLMAAAAKIAAKLDSRAVDIEKEAITAMVKYGLIVNRTSQSELAEWQKEAAMAVQKSLGTIYDKDLFNTIQTILTRLRSNRE